MKGFMLSFSEWLNESEQVDIHPMDQSDLSEAQIQTVNDPCVGELKEAKSPYSGKTLKVTPCVLSALIKMGWKEL